MPLWLWVIIGVIAFVTWVASMLLVSRFVLNLEPDTSNMSVLKRCGYNLLYILAMIYTIPVMLVIGLVDLMYSIIDEIKSRF